MFTFQIPKQEKTKCYQYTPKSEFKLKKKKCHKPVNNKMMKKLKNSDILCYSHLVLPLIKIKITQLVPFLKLHEKKISLSFIKYHDRVKQHPLHTKKRKSYWEIDIYSWTWSKLKIVKSESKRKESEREQKKKITR